MSSRPPHPVPAIPSHTALEPTPEEMHAAVIDAPGPPGALHLTRTAVPHPAMDELLVRVVAAGVNRIDADLREGRGDASEVPGYPVSLGFDFSGVVVHAPYEAHPFAPGTAVFGMTAFPRVSGSYAGYVVAARHALALKPRRLSHAEAAAVPRSALAAWQLVVETARAHAGQRILIHGGAGGVGHLAVQLAASFGAHVTTTCAAENVAWVRTLGAHVVIDRATTRFDDVVSDVDVVIDLVGNAHDETGRRSLAVLRPGGLLIAVTTVDWPDYAREAEATGVRVTSFVAAPDGAALTTISRLLDTGDLAVYVDRVFPLAEAADAHRHLEEELTRGKIVLQVSEG